MVGSVSPSSQRSSKIKIHEPGEHEAIVVLIDAEAVVIVLRRVGMDVRIVVLLFPFTLKAVAENRAHHPRRWPAEPGVSRPAAASASMPPESASGVTRTRLARRLRVIELRLLKPNEPPEPAGTAPGTAAAGTAGGGLATTSAVEGASVTGSASVAIPGNAGSGSGGNVTWSGVASPPAVSGDGLCNRAAAIASAGVACRGIAPRFPAGILQPETARSVTARLQKSERNAETGPGRWPANFPAASSRDPGRCGLCMRADRLDFVASPLETLFFDK